MSEFCVADIVVGKHDSNNREVLDVYARQFDRYAVYQTDRRVVIAYSDDPLVQKIQRRRLAGLALQRAEIDGLLDPWRIRPAGYSRLYQTARQFDMRVASALIEALEGETDAARAILDQVKAEIRGEMGSRARLAYVIWSMVSAIAVLALCTAVFLIANHLLGNSLIDAADRQLLFAGMATGILGALYSIAMRIERRNLSNDMRRLDSFTDSFVRLGLGAMGAFVLVCFLNSGAIEINFGADIRPPAGGGGKNFIYLVLISGFLAGFVERLVPDLLNSYSIAPHKEPPPPTGPARPPAETASAASAGAAANQGAREPISEDEVTNPPSEEEDIDGCDAHLDDATQLTADEDLPPSSGGVASN
ncbi:hypothetical protein C0V72_09105 [Porphyrobacter sp. TH134]|nr:hypothetical protein C0V72_09105 [Porphyrobacter sp. TH134]